MKFSISEIRFAVSMMSKKMRKETIVALFNSGNDAKAFMEYCNKQYPLFKYRVIEFDN